MIYKQIMLYKQIKNRYSEIITFTKHQIPKYEVIDFMKFIFFHLEINNAFLPESKIGSIREFLINRRLNEKVIFTVSGIIEDIPFTKLHYYQKEVGIEGPKHTLIDEPVYIFMFEGKYILWNGYHRALLKIFEGHLSIKGFVVNLRLDN
jgi:hypothetical protein